MARMRMLKPGFFKHEALAECPRDARLLFAGLWGIADREGRLEDRPRWIKSEVFPYDDDVTARHVDDWLQHLAANGHIERYEIDGRRYIWIPSFLTHQRPHVREAESILPPCQREHLPGTDPGSAEHAPSTDLGD